jgi:hypothetical protein
MLENKKPSFMESDYTVKVTEDEQSDVPNIRRGSTVYMNLTPFRRILVFINFKVSTTLQAY